MAVYQHLKNALSAPFAARAAVGSLDALLQLELSRELERLQQRMKSEMPDNPAGYGFKVYSQADEDGILQFIFERIGITRGSFVEIGCGNGLENNTHYLLLNGWRGVWVDGDPGNVAAIRSTLPDSERLRVVEAMVDRDSAPSLVDDETWQILGDLALLSVDIDGNDLHVTAACARAWRPQVIVVEYNAKFPPQAAVSVTYEPEHRWSGDDYHGASLRALAEALQDEYRLVCCNLAGTNAFFVRQDKSDVFGRAEMARLYQPARFHLTALRSGHPPSLSFLAGALGG
jgi:hypothetical protein